MKVTLIVTGSTKELWLKEGFNDYLSRIRKYIPLQLIEIPGVKVTKNTREKEVVEKEGKEILKYVKQDSYLVLLDERGKELTSGKFAEWLTHIFNTSKKQLIFVVGGAYGFSEDVKSQADYKLSLSKMTFSHQIIRLIFTEQLYRAFTIINGEPYHHGS